MAPRFDVYCRENGWLDPMGFLDRREADVDDAGHTAAVRGSFSALLGDEDDLDGATR